jgi:hypothetical protein
MTKTVFPQNLTPEPKAQKPRKAIVKFGHETCLPLGQLWAGIAGTQSPRKYQIHSIPQKAIRSQLRNLHCFSTMAVATPVHSLFRDVWLFARPLSLFQPFGSLDSLSEGKFHLQHWGVLVTELDESSFKDLTTEAQNITDDFDNLVLGIMFEVMPGPHKANIGHVRSHFTCSMAREQWASFSTDHVGMTVMTDENIRLEGTQELNYFFEPI